MEGRFAAMYPYCATLGIEPVGEGFDELDLQAKLGTERLAALMKGVESVFVINHRKYPEDHPDETKRGAEVHCVYARDLEKFLASEAGDDHAST